jgi:hypothetical protein
LISTKDRLFGKAAVFCNQLRISKIKKSKEQSATIDFHNTFGFDVVRP